MRYVSDKVVKENKTHISFFLAVYEKMWKNIVERGRPQMTIWRMRIACLTPSATSSRPEYAIFIVFPL
jgi:hypothetical protein